jgi:hypothetical protein
MICRVFRAGKYVLFAGALVAGGLIAASRPERVTGSGNPATEGRTVGAVDQISLAGSGNLTVINGDAPSLTVTADDNLLPLIETIVSGRQLQIHTRAGYSINPQTPISYTLTVPQLEKVELSGSGSVQASQFTGNKLAITLSGTGTIMLRELDYEALSVNLSGAAKATMSGVANEMTVRVSGSGDIDAKELRTATSEVRVSGSADIRLWATERLNARVSGSGDVRYRGDPKIEKRISGSGSVKPIKG